MAPVLNEPSRRRLVALEALQLGRGGVSLMARISGVARSTIYRSVSSATAYTQEWRLELHDLTSRQSLYKKMN
jgi:DNA-binding phage protein